MSSICIYAEQFYNTVEQSAAELVTAVKNIASESGHETVILVFGEDTDHLAKQLAFKGVTIYAAKSDVSAFQDDAFSVIMKEALEILSPDYVIAPATKTARALMSRTAVKMKAGITADCSDLFLGEDGEFLQRKSAFGESAQVIIKEIGKPKFVTVQTGVYEPAELIKGEVTYTELSVSKPESNIEVLDIIESQEESITGAQKVISIGRGALSETTLEKAALFADKIGAMIGGTRPVIDEGVIPFERQIGQTGETIHPNICIYLGVSGAIQHTEGVKGAHLTVAINSDSDAAIFDYSDFGAVADAELVLDELNKLY